MDIWFFRANDSSIIIHVGICNMNDVDKAYIAGLFDGEGSINFTRRPEKKKKHKGGGYRVSNSMRISMEISMTDRSVLLWLLEVLGVGTLTDKPRKGLRKDGTKFLMQYRWRCTFRDAYYVCLLIWPWAHTKLPKIQQIIEHYTRQRIEGGADVISLEEYRHVRKK
jgi:hypothetical protein